MDNQTLLVIALLLGALGSALGGFALYAVLKAVDEAKLLLAKAQTDLENRVADERLVLQSRFDIVKATFNSTLQTARDDLEKRLLEFEVRATEVQSSFDEAKLQGDAVTKAVADLAAKMAFLQGMPKG